MSAATSDADEKESATGIIAAKLDYLEADTNLSRADEPMHEPNMQATLKYFDWIAKPASITKFDVAQKAYEKWQAAVDEVERHPPFDKKLFKEANLAEAKREAREMEDFERMMRESREMFQRDMEIMKRDVPVTKPVCADGSTPAAGKCGDGTEPITPKKK